MLDKEHRKFKQKIRDWVDSELAPIASKIDQEGKFRRDIFDRMAEFKLLGIPFPTKYGGAGLDTLSYAIAVEEINRVCGSTGIILAAHTSLGCLPIFIAGNEEQKRKWLIPLAKGEKIGSFGLTEPNAGSDAANTQTTAKFVGNKYIINGTKRFITNGGVADIIVFTATQDPSKGAHGISAFVVEKGTEGFIIGKDEDKLGLRGSVTSELIFEDCAIPKENLLGKEGEGFKLFMQTLDSGRITIGACALGLAQGAFDFCIKNIKTRNQLIEKTIVDMATEIEAARLLIYNAAKLKDTGLPITKEAAMAKLFASEVGMRVATTAIELFGENGITKNYPLDRFMRDVKLMEIGEGTSEIQRVVIARALLGRK